MLVPLGVTMLELSWGVDFPSWAVLLTSYVVGLPVVRRVVLAWVGPPVGWVWLFGVFVLADGIVLVVFLLLLWYMTTVGF